MLDIVATVAAVVGVALAAVQVYYARLQLKQTTPTPDSTGDLSRSLRFARPWQPGWVQLFLGGALVGLGLVSFGEPSSGTARFDQPSDGLGAVLLILGLLSATPTVVYQSSLPRAGWRVLLAGVVFFLGLTGGNSTPEDGFSYVATLGVVVVFVSAVAYGARARPGWHRFWDYLLGPGGERKRKDPEPPPEG